MHLLIEPNIEVVNVQSKVFVPTLLWTRRFQAICGVIRLCGRFYLFGIDTRGCFLGFEKRTNSEAPVEILFQVHRAGLGRFDSDAVPLRTPRYCRYRCKLHYLSSSLLEFWMFAKNPEANYPFLPLHPCEDEEHSNQSQASSEERE